MALAGNELRSEAANSRGLADEYRGMGVTDSFTLGRRHDERAENLDRTATGLEDEAGRHYDADQQTATPEAQETPEELGSTAVEATQIPVTEDVGNPYPDRVEDVEKAHAMALAGKESREELERYCQGWGSGLRDYGEKMKHYDRKVEVQEYWAGFLHDHPIDPEIEKKYDIKLDLEKLVELQLDSEHFQDVAWTWERDSIRYDDPDKRDLTRLVDDLIESTRYGVPGSGSWQQEIDGLLKGEESNSTTIGQIVELYKEFHKRGKRAADERRKHVDQILEDVRSGRANEQSSKT